MLGLVEHLNMDPRNVGIDPSRWVPGANDNSNATIIGDLTGRQFIREKE